MYELIRDGQFPKSIPAEQKPPEKRWKAIHVEKNQATAFSYRTLLSAALCLTLLPAKKTILLVLILHAKLAFSPISKFHKIFLLFSCL